MNVRIFVSFEFDRDVDLKNNFFKQAGVHSPHQVVSCSLNEAYPDRMWKNKATEAIRESDIVVVLVGQDTHNAPGVKTEVNIARGLGKPVCQVVPHGRPYHGLPSVEDRVLWKWNSINAKIDQLCARRVRRQR